MNVLVINGVNLNMLGIREPHIYGEKTYRDLEEYIEKEAAALGVNARVVQSNHEGALVEFIQNARGAYDGIVINAGAYTHTSVAILDALKAAGLPAVEVHLSDLSARESFRQFSYISLYAQKVIAGKGFLGYKEALEYFVMTKG